MMLAAGLKKSQSLTEEAIKIEKEIVTLYPTYEAAFSNMLLNMIYTDKVSSEEAFEWHKEYGRRYEPSSLEKNTNSPDPTRKLKVGYVSADYFNHSVAHFALPLISRHNRAEFEVHCYATSQRSGPVTEQFKRESIWHQVDTLTDDQLAAKIREDEIDILKPEFCLFFTGHKFDNRLGNIFTDLQFIAVEGFDPNVLVQLKSPDLPSLCYRTSHPKWISLQNKKSQLKDRLESFITQIGRSLEI